MVSLLALGSCLPSEPTGSRSRPAETTLLVRADLSGTTVATVVVEVTAPDIAARLVFNISVTDRVALGIITLAARSDRPNDMRADHTGDGEEQSEALTVALQHGTSPAINRVALPLRGDGPSK